MGKFKCMICGYMHDESTDGLFEELAPNWVCPICGAEKALFEAEEGTVQVKTEVKREIVHDEHELSALELSVICSNLARGCEKQYLQEEAKLFLSLSENFKSGAVYNETEKMETLLDLVKEDLDDKFPLVLDIATKEKDRGALRAYTWSNKVSMFGKSLLERYQTLGDKMLENTKVYVCTICGFIYLGDDLPNVCPVCKVPNNKFEEIGDN